MRALLALLGALVILGLTAPPAQGTDGLLVAALDHADAWWASQGSPSPCGRSASRVRIEVPPHTPASSGAAWATPCQVWVNPQWWNAQRYILTYEPRWTQVNVLAGICAVADHEVGHLIGYDHNRPHTVMAQPMTAPGDCYRWAAQIAAPSRRLHRLTTRRLQHML